MTHPNRRIRLEQNGLGFGVAVSALISVAGFILQPTGLEHSSIATTLGETAAWVWIAAYGLGGLLVLYGLARPNARAEVAGLTLMGGALLSYAIAVLSVFGVPRGLTIAATYIALACLGFGARIIHLLHASKVLDRREVDP